MHPLSENHNDSTASDELPAPGLAVAGGFHSLKEAGDRGLVVLAMGLPYWIHAINGEYQLCVAAEALPAVEQQLDRFERENANWPPRAPDDEEALGAKILPPLIFCVILTLIHFTTIRQPGDALREIGTMDAVGVIRRGEWWRTITALTLHADIGHLAANLGAGVFFAWFAARRLGSGFAWLLITLAGALGNALTAWFYYPAAHFSIGGSTAVFGALGLLIGRPLARRPASPANPAPAGSKRPAMIRAAAVLVLLALLGAGGARTDVLAHAMGFVVGAGLAWLPARLQDKVAHSLLVQQACALAALGLLAGAWWFAWLRE